MFCSNCGKESSGKFCSECGAQLTAATPADEPVQDNQDAIIEVVGQKIDMNELRSLYGNDKINSIKHIAHETGAGLAAAKKAYEDGVKKMELGTEKKVGFWEEAKLRAAEQQKEKALAQKAAKERLAALQRDGIAYCPKCHSTSLSAHKKGFGIGKAVVGAALTGGIGLVAGNIGAKKVRVTCLKCGHQFWAGGK